MEVAATVDPVAVGHKEPLDPTDSPESKELVVPIVSKAINMEVAAGSVETLLTRFVDSCGDMDELKSACTALGQRLVETVTELLEREASNRLPASDVLAQFPELLAKCLAYHDRFADKPLVTRLTQHAKRIEQLKALFEELETFRGTCHLLVSSRSVDDAEVLRLLGEAAANDDRVLAGLDDARAQLEALSQLKYYLDLSAPDDELTKLLKKVSTTIGQEASTVVATLPLWYVPADDVAFDDEPFAQGSFGSVHHGTWHARGGAEQRVVVKRLLVKTGMSEIVTERFIDEVSIWHKLDHPNVLKLLGASHVSSPPFFVCQRAAHDNMAVYLASTPRARRRMWRLLFGAAKGLAHIHKNYIVHGDLKLNNILVAQDDAEDVVACVGDFGLSFVRPSAQAVQPVSDVDTARPRGGGLRWRSPESLKKRPTFASDIYSLAMCIIEAATGEPPYAALDDEHVHKELKEGNIPPRPEQLTDDAWVLVQAMAQFEPSGRLSLAEVLKVLEDFAAVEKAENEELDKQDELLAQAETRAVEPPSSPRGRRNTGSTPGAGIVPLVQLLRAGTPDQMHYAAHTLGDLAADTEANRRDVVKAGGIPLLADMVLHSTSDVLKDEATRVLQLLASEGDTCVLIASAGCTELLLPLLHTGSTQQKNAVAFSLSTFLSGDGSNSVQIKVDASAIHSLVELLGTGDEGQKLYAARALSNLASSHATHELITSATVIAPLLKLVQSGNDEQSLYALKALGALASQPGVCGVMADLHGVAALVAQLHTLGEDHQQYALTALGHLAKASHANCVAIDEADGVAPLVTLLGGEPGELQRLAGVVVRRMTKSNQRLCVSLFDAGVVPPLAEILRSGEPSEAKSAAKTLGQVAKLHATSGRAMSDAGAVPPLVAMLQHGDDKLKSVAETTLTALLQDEESCLTIAEHGGYAVVFDMLQRGTDAQKRAAVFAIAVSFAVDSDPASKATVRRLEPLIGFLRRGTDTQKTLALRVFGQLASISMNRPSLVAADLAAPLVALVEAKKTSPTLRVAATAVLGQLATEDDGAASIVAHGGIDAVAALLLGSYSAAHEAEAALTLAHLAHEPTHCTAIAELDVVPAAMQLLQKGTPVQQERAAFLLARLTQDASVHETITASDGLALLESLLVQADASTALQEHAAMALAGVLASPQELEVVTRLELLTALVELLERGNDGAKLGAAASLAHVARQHPERMEKFLVSPTGTRMVPLLLALLRTGVGGQREHAALALGVCAALSASVQQSIVATGGVEVLARQLQTSAIGQALPLLRALAPVVAHAQAFQSAKVVSLLAGVAASDSTSTKHKLAAVDTLRALPSLLPTEATEAIAMAQLLLRSDEGAEHEAGAALLLQLVGSHAKLVAQRGAATELVAVIQRAKGSSSAAKVDALQVLLALVDEKDALKTAGAVDAVVALLAKDGAETEATTAAVERLAVALARSKLMARDVVDKWLLPRLEQTAASGGSGPRLELAREAIASFKSKRSSFSLGGRARSMSSEQSIAKE